MMGGMFAGTEEAPGEVILFQGRTYKSYRGMGSVGAMTEGSADRYFQDAVEQHRQARARRHRGPGAVQGLGRPRSCSSWSAACAQSMGYCGCATIDDLRGKAEFVEITTAGIRESHVHDVQITKEAPNYRVE